MAESAYTSCFESVERIIGTEQPERVGQYLAARNEARQIEELSERIGEDLSAEDLASINRIFQSENFEDFL